MKTIISDKFKNVFKDVFDQEKKITRHFINHAESLSKDSKVVEGILSLQILQTKDDISTILCKGKTGIKLVPIDELALFFTDSFTANLIPRSHIEQKIKKYFQSFQTDLDTKSVGIRIVIFKNEIVKIYTLGTQETKEVSLTEFINFFKS